MRAGSLPHGSRSEFRADITIEREADAFAASLLLPTQMVRRYVNQEELTIGRIEELTQRFQTSVVSTAIRSVRLSHFPCAVAGIRQGGVAWMFLSECMIEAGLYPMAAHLPANAAKVYAEVQLGSAQRQQAEGRAHDWFAVYDDRKETAYVTEVYVPIPAMNTILMLLTMDEFDDNNEDEDED